MPAKLRYSLSSEPFPLNPNITAMLSVVVSAINPKEKVTLLYITITLPIGTKAGDLTAIAPTFLVPPDGWEAKDPKPGEGTLEFIFVPKAGKAEIDEEGLAFIFNAIKVNSRPGTCNVPVKEIIEVAGKPVTTVTPLSVAKFPRNFGPVDFAVNPPIIKAGETTQLSWNGPEATYTIDYYTPQAGRVHVPKPGKVLSNNGVYPDEGDPPLTLETTTDFYLSVVLSIGSERYSAQQHRPVTVIPRPPDPPTIKYFRPRGCTGSECFIYDDECVLEWEIVNASLNQCQLTEKDPTQEGKPARIIPIPWEDNFVVVRPTIPLTRYTMTILDKTERVTATVTATLIPPVPIGTIVPFGGERADRLPKGWLYCNGKEYSKKDYPDLYPVIGNLYGTSKSADSGVLPDLRGYFVRGYNDDADVDPGRKMGSKQDDTFKSHAHGQKVTANVGFGSAIRADYNQDASKLGDYDQGVPTYSTGDRETRPKNLACYYVIYAGPMKPPSQSVKKKDKKTKATAKKNKTTGKKTAAARGRARTGRGRGAR